MQEETLNKILSIVENVLNRITILEKNEEKIEGVRKEMKEISNKNVKEIAEEISSLAESISRKSHQSNKKIRKEMQSLLISDNKKELNKEIHI